MIALLALHAWALTLELGRKMQVGVLVCFPKALYNAVGIRNPNSNTITLPALGMKCPSEKAPFSIGALGLLCQSALFSSPVATAMLYNTSMYRYRAL